jgi:hypothetical protein
MPHWIWIVAVVAFASVSLLLTWFFRHFGG